MPVNELQCTLLSDGSADRALIPILRWLLHEHLPGCAVQAHWADLRRVPKLPKTLHERIQVSVKLYPCDLIFVHRDAEGMSLIERKGEIDDAVRRAYETVAIPPAIAVVPVRMTESWLLTDGCAIKAAAGNPNGSIELDLPRLGDVESIPNPKNLLYHLILQATEKGTRRRRHFDVRSAVHRIPQCMESFSTLRVLSAFVALENQVEEVIGEQRWRE
jgi:hypothetical protein